MDSTENHGFQVPTSPLPTPSGYVPPKMEEVVVVMTSLEVGGGMQTSSDLYIGFGVFQVVCSVF